MSVIVCVCVCVCVFGGGRWPEYLPSVFVQQQAKGSVPASQPQPSAPCPCPATLAQLQKYRKTTAGITSPRCWIKSSLYPQKSRTNMRNVNVCTERGKKRHLKIYIYSEPVEDQTAKLICSSFNPCSAPSPQFPFSPSIDFLHGPLP